MEPHPSMEWCLQHNLSQFEKSEGKKTVGLQGTKSPNIPAFKILHGVYLE